ncbi:DUF559 domain-containing protein [Solirubrobacter phytolaccae]|uniref:DUF559 domain-containing protein n=1 Tax=Solirubrobacter phytolaccae TaxID=1404360 RepID=A0A9X3NEA6_9ACTN|nr:DUF559 domain-containing protein [Solirubrobacter phytolaccae]
MSPKVRHTGVSGHTPSPDQRIRGVAARQRDLVTLTQLRHAGLTNGGIARRVDDGVLRRVFRGVYTTSQAVLSPETLGLAATMACGPGAGLSHYACGTLYGISRFRSSLIDVVSPRKRTLEGVRVHRSRTLTSSDITSIRGIPVTTVPRLYVDFADVLTPFQLANVIHEAAYENLSTSLPEAAGRHNQKTLAKAFELHAQGSAGTRSPAEDAFLDLDLPEPLVNVVHLGFEVDFRWPEQLVAVEVDGGQHVRRPYSRNADARRDEVLRAHGYTVLRFPAKAVLYRGSEVERRVLDTLSVRPAP